MKAATVVTQIDPANTQSSSEALIHLRRSGHEVSPSAPVSSLDVQVKQVKAGHQGSHQNAPAQWRDSHDRYWEVRMGSAIAKVYATATGERDLFTVSYWVDGKRKLEIYKSKAEAMKAAKKAVSDLGSGNLTAPNLTPQQLLACKRALDLIAPFNVEIDVAAGVHAMFAQRFQVCAV